MMSSQDGVAKQQPPISPDVYIWLSAEKADSTFFHRSSIATVWLQASKIQYVCLNNRATASLFNFNRHFFVEGGFDRLQILRGPYLDQAELDKIFVCGSTETSETHLAKRNIPREARPLGGICAPFVRVEPICVRCFNTSSLVLGERQRPMRRSNLKPSPRPSTFPAAQSQSRAKVHAEYPADALSATW